MSKAPNRSGGSGLSAKTVRMIIAAAIALAAIGFMQWKKHHPPSKDGANSTPAARATGTSGKQTPAQPLMLGSLSFKPCSLSAKGGADPVEAQCTTFSVPENRAQPGGRKIALNIAWVPASNANAPESDPVFFIAGGPGQSSVQMFPMLAPALGDLMKTRHVMLVDQRGTGASNPLNCKNDEGNDDSIEKGVAAIQACMEALKPKADLARYTTTDAVADLEDVRKAIGAEKINLYGVSYGTRVAQQYAMRHPASTRTVTLDSPVPNSLGLGNIFARNLEDALTAQFAVCQKTPACKDKMGDTRAELQALLTRLRSQPVEVSYRDISTGEMKTEKLTADAVAGLVRMFSYMPSAASLLPLQIHEASQGRYSSLMALARMLQNDMSEAMSVGMQFSVVCTEDPDSMVARAEDAETVLGNRHPEAMAAMCKIWPRGEKPADFNKPLTGNVPVLILSGEYDPVTPPKYGEEIAKSLPNGRWLTLKGQGHGVITAGCMPKLFAQFLEKADAKALDAKCLDTLPPLLPFTSFNGWEP